ncbi:peroxiredoxin [Shinella sumterensis]|uniref:Glutathione-dependent peroxiredoxin n=1 Tax=Shinella oryzae TaxID=2871820 RepID=A0ABY9KCN6_9HYPH|nr:MULTISPECIES: peroxiredoxin [Shinella]MCD1265140.1 redoxin family protein [Shinella sumterensis]TFE98537.1 peroxiredoxin [Shinella sumterensis]WLS04551.1 peroxiredoxin [Shinella oryzae]WLS09396.1 peroxiredoxin [Shinella sumterensis]
MTIAVGDKLPDLKLKERTPDGPADVSTAELFGGKRIVLFAVPGAFTPTCSLNHLPGYLENRDAILAKGVDDIVVVAVNDQHVMGAWATSTGGAGKLRFIADWDAAFTKALGMDIDLSAGTLGVRSKRYSMLVDDGVVKTLNVEESPGQATVSAAAAMIEQL